MSREQRQVKLDRKFQDAWLKLYKKTRHIGHTCEAFGISRVAIQNLMKRDQEFRELRSEIDRSAIETTVGALKKKADGYDYDEVKEELEWVTDSKTGERKLAVVKKVITKKHVPPDVGASVFYLCNRDKANWRNVQRIEHSGQVGTPIDLSKLSTDDLVKLAKSKDKK